MKYTTYLNNAKMLEWGLNFSQAVVFDWLTLVPGWAEQMIEGKEVWYFASRTTCLKELPTVGTSEDTIYRIYKALEKLGLIEYKKVGVKDYIKLSKKAKEWHYKDLGKKSEHSEIHPKALGNPSENNSDENPTYNITTLDNNISDNNAREDAQPPPPKKEITDRTKYNAKDFIQWGRGYLIENYPSYIRSMQEYEQEWYKLALKIYESAKNHQKKNGNGVAKMEHCIKIFEFNMNNLNTWWAENFNIGLALKKYDDWLNNCEAEYKRKKKPKKKETYHPTGGAVWEDPKNYRPR